MVKLSFLSLKGEGLGICDQPLRPAAEHLVQKIVMRILVNVHQKRQSVLLGLLIKSIPRPGFNGIALQLEPFHEIHQLHFRTSEKQEGRLDRETEIEVDIGPAFTLGFIIN